MEHHTVPPGNTNDLMDAGTCRLHFTIGLSDKFLIAEARRVEHTLKAAIRWKSPPTGRVGAGRTCADVGKISYYLCEGILRVSSAPAIQSCCWCQL